MEATADSCSTAITDSISKSLTDTLAMAAAEEDVSGEGGPLIALAATKAQTDCVVAVRGQGSKTRLTVQYGAHAACAKRPNCNMRAGTANGIRNPP